MIFIVKRVAHKKIVCFIYKCSHGSKKVTQPTHSEEIHTTNLNRTTTTIGIAPYQHQIASSCETFRVKNRFGCCSVTAIVTHTDDELHKMTQSHTNNPKGEQNFRFHI